MEKLFDEPALPLCIYSYSRSKIFKILLISALLQVNFFQMTVNVGKPKDLNKDTNFVYFVT